MAAIAAPAAAQADQAAPVSAEPALAVAASLSEAAPAPVTPNQPSVTAAPPALTPVPPVTGAPARPKLPRGCERLYTVAKYRHYARQVYQRSRISSKAKRQLREMTNCQHSGKARKAVRRHRDRLIQHRKLYLCTQDRVVNCIRLAARKYNVSFDMLMRKAHCESRLNPHATNGAHDGLFQFRTAPPSTWATTPYRNKSVWSAKWNAFAAAWMHSVGRGGEWECR